MFALFILSLWYIKNIEGSVIVSVEGRTFRASKDSSEYVGVYFWQVSYATERFSRIFLIKQSLAKPSEHKELVVDEATRTYLFKDGITIYYGKLYIDLKNFQEDEVVYFYNTPFFVKIKAGEVVIFSADTGYFLYCIKCEGDFWEMRSEKIRDVDGQTAMKGMAVSIRPLVYRNIFFISKNGVDGELADPELHDLLIGLISRIKSKDKFAKDVIYVLPEEFPKPAFKKDKKFKTVDPERELPALRHSILTEYFCYELMKSGVECKKLK